MPFKYRNTINNGCLIITCSERGNECSHWDSLKKVPDIFSLEKTCLLWHKPKEAAHTQENWLQQSQCKMLSPEHAESNTHNK